MKGGLVVSKCSYPHIGAAIMNKSHGQLPEHDDARRRWPERGATWHQHKESPTYVDNPKRQMSETSTIRPFCEVGMALGDHMTKWTHLIG
jgi:hypothetical protein